MAKFNQGKTTILIGLIVILVIVAGWALFSFTDLQLIPQEKGQELTEEVKEEVFLVINYGEEPVPILKADFREGMTAFDLLEEKAEELKINLKTKNYDFGVFIETIGDKENGSEGKYWLYYVNGEMPSVAADRKELKPSDKVEFKFEKSPF